MMGYYTKKFCEYHKQLFFKCYTKINFEGRTHLLVFPRLSEKKIEFFFRFLSKFVTKAMDEKPTRKTISVKK
jgi:hypothetical protein